MKTSIARMKPIVRFLFGLLFAQALAGCSGGGSARSPSAEPLPSEPPTTLGATLHGRFVGTVRIGAEEHYGDALITVDGAVRLYVGGPYGSDGTVQRSKPESSAQFVGHLDMQGGEAFGNGVIIGQGCAASGLRRFCGQTAFGEISITVDSGEIQGKLQVTATHAEQTWLLELTPWKNFYVVPAALASVAGQYDEELAEFSDDGDVVVNVDRAGQMFFQSAHSGCIGNGTLAPHLNGEFNVYDVTLTIEGCDATHASLNGEFEGLATQSPNSFWDYDSLLRIWLSTPDGTPSQAAVTMSGRPLFRQTERRPLM